MTSLDELSTGIEGDMGRWEGTILGWAYGLARAGAEVRISAFEGGCIGIEMRRGAQVPRRDAPAQRKPVSDMTID
jgi:hypothetical protein